jgi:hypothetical protein
VKNRLSFLGILPFFLMSSGSIRTIASSGLRDVKKPAELDRAEIQGFNGSGHVLEIVALKSEALKGEALKHIGAEYP